MSERLASHESELEALRVQAETARAALQHDTAQHQAAYDGVSRQLAISMADAARLRDVAAQATGQIDSILMRLPGAPQE
jgi:hypothetical protein